MKSYLSKYIKAFRLICLAAILAIPVTRLMADAVDTSTTKPEATIDMKYFKENGIRKIKLKVTQTVNDEEVPVPFMVVNVYLYNRSKHGMMGNVNTNEKGEGEVILDSKRFQFQVDSAKQPDYQFMAYAGSDSRFAPAEAELTVSDVNLTLKLDGNDTDKKVTARLFKIVDGKEVPLKGEEVHVYIKRTFNPFALTPQAAEGEDAATTTDENGEFTVACPNDMPGDEKGNIIIMARLEDNDTYGNVVVEQPVKWGIPLKADVNYGRELWGTRENAPYWLIILSCSIIAGVWLTICYVIFQFFKIKRLGKTA